MFVGVASLAGILEVWQQAGRRRREQAYAAATGGFESLSCLLFNSLAVACAV